jgi:hypothetical protein
MLLFHPLLPADRSVSGGRDPSAHSRETWARIPWSRAGCRLQRRTRSIFRGEFRDVPSRAGSRERP